jgi:hypothetical protein
VHGREQRVPVEQLEIAGELLHSVDLAAALDLDGDVGAVSVTAHDVDRPDRGRVLAPDEPPAVAEEIQLLGEQLLQVRLDAVLDQAGVDAQVHRGVAERLLDRDGQGLARLVGDRPLVRLLGQPARRRHPVQRLVGAAVRMHEDRAVGLDDEQPQGGRKMSGEPAVVVDAAPGDYEPHGTSL